MGERPARVAVIGAGPSGLYTVQALLAGSPDLLVDVYDRLPSPFGLLRYGVAPDHTSIKAVAVALGRVFESPRVRFLGMVDVGRTLTRADLVACYDAVVYAVGAADDQRLGVPGEQVEGSKSARQFVAWYSGHPDATPQSLGGVRQVVTVGVGNVALDVARLLVMRPDELDPTDMPEGVLAELARHTVDTVTIVGRRGVEHATFTPPELRELVERPDVDVDVSGVDWNDLAAAKFDRRTTSNVAILRAADERPAGRARVKVNFAFWQRPVRVLGESRVEGVVMERTSADAAGVVTGTGDLTTEPTQLLLRAIGYRGHPVPGVPFDAVRGVIPTREGRVVDGERVRSGEYAVGWIKRGANGVIGTNKVDATQTAAVILGDLADASPAEWADPDEMVALRHVTPTTLADWLRIDSAEQSLGSSHGRARTKIESWSDLLDLVE
jgi:ferredoxin/flavodoxin---NADP+ reductase